MELQQAISDGAEIMSANLAERAEVLNILTNNGVRECFQGLGAADGLVISLFPDGTYMVDGEASSTHLVPAREFLKVNKYVA